MLKRILQVLVTLGGFALGVLSVFAIERMEIFDVPSGLLGGAIYFVAGVILAAIMFMVSPSIYRAMVRLTKKIESELENVPIQDIILGIVGLILGLVIAFFVSQPLYKIPVFGTFLSIAAYLILGYLGIRVSLRSKRDLLIGAKRFKVYTAKEEDPVKVNQVESKVKSDDYLGDSGCKVLDTSVIIDGRIAEIIKAGFIEGRLIIPNFVLLELQHIADSSDDLRRERGRRGLDILKDIQDQNKIPVEINHEPYNNIEEVDSKLLALAKDLNGKVVTNDYNLNKVAEVRGIRVLNINELANAVKAPVMHGQTITVSIVKEGSEQGQGIAYLDDGTMIVVEDGKDFIGENVKVSVTSVIQTSAGKMIFTKVKQ